MLVIDPVDSLRDPLADGWAASPIDRMELLLRSADVKIGVVTDGSWWAIVSARPQTMLASGITSALTWTESPATRNAFIELLRRVRLIGGNPEEHPERYAISDPLTRVPIPAIVRCIHARADDRVPLTQSVTYVAAAQASGGDDSLGHGSEIGHGRNPSGSRIAARTGRRRLRAWSRPGRPGQRGREDIIASSSSRGESPAGLWLPDPGVAPYRGRG